MTKLGIAINLERCVGCNTCANACKMENNIPMNMLYIRVETDGVDTADGAQGTYPDLSRTYIPVACQHCDEPQCVEVCPTGASYKREDGVVLVDHSKCIGCQYCVMACPYGVRTYDTSKDKGVIEKCTMCAHLIDKGEKPACVKHCPGQARKFGDLDDPQSDVSKLRAAKKTYKLKDVGNHPGVDYAMDKCAWKGDE